MNRIKHYLILLSILFLLISCDCEIYVFGKVVSTKTGKPIEGAKIEMINKGLVSTSNKNGTFQIGEFTGFCYDPELKITYANHKPFIFKVGSKSIYRNYSIKKETDFIEFEEPFYPNEENKKTFLAGTWIEKYSKDFKIKSDSIIVYLDEINIKKELEEIKKNLKIKKN